MSRRASWPDEFRPNESPAWDVLQVPGLSWRIFAERSALGGRSFEKVGSLMLSSFAQKSKTHRRPAAVALLAVLAITPQSRASPRSNWAIDPARTRISFSIDAVGYPRTRASFTALTAASASTSTTPHRAA